MSQVPSRFGLGLDGCVECGELFEPGTEHYCHESPQCWAARTHAVTRAAANEFWTTIEFCYHPLERARVVLAGLYSLDEPTHLCLRCGEVFVGSADLCAHRCNGQPMLGCLNIGLVIAVALRVLCSEPVPPESPAPFTDATQDQPQGEIR